MLEGVLNVGGSFGSNWVMPARCHVMAAPPNLTLPAYFPSYWTLFEGKYGSPANMAGTGPNFFRGVEVSCYNMARSTKYGL